MKRKIQNLSRLFHYTVGMHLENIFRDKYLKLAINSVATNEKAAVWLTYSQDWENTANKGLIAIQNGKLVQISMNKEETEANCGGLYRIEIKPDKYANNDWRSFKQLSGIHRIFASGCYTTAVSAGSRVGLWRYSFDTIPIEDWICLEKWDGREWIRVEFDEYLNQGIFNSLEVSPIYQPQVNPKLRI